MSASARITLLAVGGSITLTLAVLLVSKWVYIDPAYLLPVLLFGCIGGWSLWNRWEGDELVRRLDSERAASQGDRHINSDSPGRGGMGVGRRLASLRTA